MSNALLTEFGIHYISERCTRRSKFKTFFCFSLGENQKILRLIDFGCAQKLSPSMSYHRPATTQQGSGAGGGNLEFRAPEVISGGPVATYTDMWAVGVVIYVCLRYVLSVGGCGGARPSQFPIFETTFEVAFQQWQIII